VSKFWKRDERALERMLRSERAEARDGLVADLTQRTNASRPGRTWSKVAFATALTVFMVGSFASFGGLGYAASSAQHAAKSVTHAVSPQKAHKPATSLSAAQVQYGPQQYTPPAAKPNKVIEVAGISTEKPSSSDELPFTGLGLGLTAALGSVLLALGLVLRRRESRAKR
jgi:hypothetical protein